MGGAVLERHGQGAHRTGRASARRLAALIEDGFAIIATTKRLPLRKAPGKYGLAEGRLSRPAVFQRPTSRITDSGGQANEPTQRKIPAGDS
jgi:hypothetical protein